MSDPVAPAPSPKCRACTSPHAAEIDRRLLAGDSTRKVAEWLQAECGEHHTFQALYKHLRGHLRGGIAAEVKRIVSEVSPEPVAPPPSRPMTEPARAVVRERLHHLDILAWCAIQAQDMAEAMAAKIHESPKPGMTLATLYLGCLREAREAALSTHEILEGDRPVEVNAHIDSLGDLLGLALSPQPQPQPADKPTDP